MPDNPVKETLPAVSDQDTQKHTTPPSEGASRPDEGWLNTLLPVLTAAVVSIACTLVFVKFFNTAPVLPNATPPSVVVFDMADWVKGVPADATPEDMETYFSQAKRAADFAAEKGYLVVNSNVAMSFPDALRLTPDSTIIEAMERETE